MHAGVAHMPMDPAGMSADASQPYVYGESVIIIIRENNFYSLIK